MNAPIKTQSPAEKTIPVTIASFWLRLIAWIYDLLGAIAVFILALVIGYLVIYLVTLPWVTNGGDVSTALSNNPLWFLYLALSVQYYYVWCWVKGGQTIGMRTWRLKLCHPDGTLLNWKQAYQRSFASLGGLSLLWCLVDSDKRGLHDILCGSLVVVLPKGYNKETKPLI